MGVEIERKFLVTSKAFTEGVEGVSLVQGYIESGEGKVVRVRTAGPDAYLTLKGKTEGYSRLEYEYAIPKTEAEEILEHLCNKPLISKTRYYVPFEGKTWEVDIFDRDNEGLLLAEIELSSEEEEFTLPPWVGEEVSHDKRYRNNYLALHPFTTWEHE